MAHPDCTTEQCPVQINYFARHTAIVDGYRKTFLLFSASWFKPHRDRHLRKTRLFLLFAHVTYHHKNHFTDWYPPKWVSSFCLSLNRFSIPVWLSLWLSCICVIIDRYFCKLAPRPDESWWSAFSVPDLKTRLGSRMKNSYRLILAGTRECWLGCYRSPWHHWDWVSLAFKNGYLHTC